LGDISYIDARSASRAAKIQKIVFQIGVPLQNAGGYSIILPVALLAKRSGKKIKKVTQSHFTP